MVLADWLMASGPAVSLKSAEPLSFAKANVPPFIVIVAASLSRLALLAAAVLLNSKVAPLARDTEAEEAIAPSTPVRASVPPLTAVAPL